MEEIAMYILDIVNNSLKAGSKNIHVYIRDSQQYNIIDILIVDDGCGMDEETLKKVTDPFFTSRTTRNVGLGVPMFKDSVEMTGGYFVIDSRKSVGTTLNGTYIRDHLDTPPMGNLIDTIMTLLQYDENVDYIFEYSTDDHEFLFNTIDIKNILEDVSITDYNVLMWLKDYLKEGFKL